MKSFFILGFVALLLVLTACQKQEEVLAINGVWYGKQSVLKGFASGVPVPVINETDSNFDTIVDFNDNGSVLVTDEGSSNTGTWTYTEDQQGVNISADLQNDLLEPTETFQIQELSESSLILFLDKSGTFDVPNVGQVAGRIELTLRFDRQSN